MTELLLEDPATAFTEIRDIGIDFPAEQPPVLTSETLPFATDGPVFTGKEQWYELDAKIFGRSARRPISPAREPL